MKCMIRGTRRDRGYSVYRFPGEDGPEFDYNDVINHRLTERKKLPGQRRLERFLLAIGGRMPAKLRGGQRLDLPLAIIAADHAEYATTLHLCTQRLQARTKTAVRQRTPIFAKPAGQAAMYLDDVNTQRAAADCEQSCHSPIDTDVSVSNECSLTKLYGLTNNNLTR